MVVFVATSCEKAKRTYVFFRLWLIGLVDCQCISIMKSNLVKEVMGGHPRHDQIVRWVGSTENRHGAGLAGVRTSSGSMGGVLLASINCMGLSRWGAGASPGSGVEAIH